MTQQELKPWSTTDIDLTRWKGIKQVFLSWLQDGKWVNRTVLTFLAGGSINPATRISELRKEGFDIECSRAGKSETFYRIVGYTPGVDMRKKAKPTCPHCGGTL